MTIEAKIIADSISPAGVRLTTFQLRYPRFIHAEAKTHRIIEIDGTIYEEMVDMGFMDDPNLSRNASSSRAIPVDRLIADIRRDPAMPVYWGGHQSGMQAAAELTGNALDMVKHHWLEAMEEAIYRAQSMREYGLHKQIANRILEPWAYINVVVTATEYENFFALRCHKDAQPEIKVLADLMREQMRLSVPNELQPGEWHLPYISADESISAYAEANSKVSIQDGLTLLEQMKRVSIARCARVSYLTHDGRPTTVEEDLALYERLVGGAPLHASPAEHQATPDIWVSYEGQRELPHYEHPKQHGNLNGWRQLRKMLPNEFVPG